LNDTESLKDEQPNNVDHLLPAEWFFSRTV
jgi:hypothetical protein